MTQMSIWDYAPDEAALAAARAVVAILEAGQALRVQDSYRVQQTLARETLTRWARTDLDALAEEAAAAMAAELAAREARRTAAWRAYDTLCRYLRRYGPQQAVRCSAAASRARYSYWGVAQYRLYLDGQGVPRTVCTAAALAERRSRRLVERDLAARVAETGAVEVTVIGEIGPWAAEAVLARIRDRARLQVQTG